MFLLGDNLTALMGEWTAGASEIWLAGGVTLAFTLIARWIRGVARSGAVAGAVICFALYVSAGPGAFVTLVSVFALAWITTRVGYGRKQQLGTAERREGRTASQVLANLGVAAVCGVLYTMLGRPELILALVAALSEAAADTVSSEIGQAASGKARLITNWQEVPAGTDGGVTAAGTLAGMVAAVIVSGVAALSGLFIAGLVIVPASAAVLGMIADSYLGAWLERRGRVNNDTVNFLSTLIAAGLAIAMTRAVQM